MDGYETCELIKQNPLLRDVPIIFVSAKNEAIDKVKGLNLGAVDYINKPFDVSEIVARIKSHLSLYFTQKTLEQKMSIIDKNVITSSTDLNGIITEASEAFLQNIQILKRGAHWTKP
jgi:DNA-binding response OmpR family regulator